MQNYDDVEQIKPAGKVVRRSAEFVGIGLGSMLLASGFGYIGKVAAEDFDASLQSQTLGMLHSAQPRQDESAMPDIERGSVLLAAGGVIAGLGAALRRQRHESLVSEGVEAFLRDEARFAPDEF